MSIYVNMSSRSEFASALAKDGRSYKSSLFNRAIQILENNMLMSADKLAIIRNLVGRVEVVLQADAILEEEYGDIPDEFLDPLMCTIMDDPVIIPTSNMTLDRSTITSHLLSDGHDPFNRMLLVSFMYLFN